MWFTLNSSICQLYFTKADCKEIQPVHPKGDQSWVFTGRTDTEAETPILCLPHAKSWPIGKDPDAGRDWGQEEKGTAENEMAEWHHWLDGCRSEWTPGGDGQGGLACCDSWGRRVGPDWATELTDWLTDCMGSWLLKITCAEDTAVYQGHVGRVGDAPVVSLYPLCRYRACAGVGKVWLFCSIFVSYPGPALGHVWGGIQRSGFFLFC